MSAGIEAAPVRSLGHVLANANCDVFVINLDRRGDRWEQISRHLRELNCDSFQRVAAVDGLKESDALARKVVRMSNEPSSDELPTNRQRGVLGCLKSHLKALKMAAKCFGARDAALILEDDCIFIEDAPDVLARAMDELPPGWQFLMLGAVYGAAPGFVPAKDHIMRVYNATAAHAYMVHEDSCRLLIQRIESLMESQVLYPVDQLFVNYQPKDEWYAAHPLIAGQRSGDFSDIEGIVREHTDQCFKLGVKIDQRVWLWMNVRPYLPMALLRATVACVSSLWIRLLG